MARPRKTLTAEQIAQVEKLAAVLNQEQIADFFGIDADTFRAICARDPAVSRSYKKGRSNAAASIAGNLIQQARDGNTTAAIFYLKTQCGWREAQKLEHTGDGGGPVRFVVVEDYSGDGAEPEAG